MSAHSVFDGIKTALVQPTFLTLDNSEASYDAVIQFYSAEGLPKMDLMGHADPYFIANIDDRISYTSSIQSNTGTPVWDDEKWIVRNIPFDAKLTVKIFDKDDEKIIDDYIGEFSIVNLINYRAPSIGHEIISPLFARHNGYFHLSVSSMLSAEGTKHLPRYTFDGPCRYSRHDSLAVGRLTMLNADCIYSTWKIQMKRISMFFKPQERQHWNKKYKAAQAIFSDGPLAVATKATIKLAHKTLYGRTLKHNENGTLTNADDLWKLVFADRTTKSIKPCRYTYVIDDNTWRFSETDIQFFADFASKHALLANGSEYVRYAGEFHPRPKHGWAKCDNQWEIVFDNGSGTYAPSPELLINLKDLLLFNFPGLNIVTYDYQDPELKKSLAALKEAVENNKTTVSTIQNIVFSCPDST
ncbi:unnamed protein product [Rotaria socialis]|uniref:C2 domain-containing protein n=1 Tax=Rotaria socialis TaxID=392032 RepID=A0A817T3F9_9BILA|nr:unnamed protein product [Rotaria socialis]CAF3349184.1 unnamed protein product [Rotaria socialis]CAF3410955.1 unnamed protein product [Rotaria socialis]CAF3603632.1 unnamed protein product [Rotaria socialis]CAF4310332.1 unnamed protein product [Rotaria socialis]